MNDLKRGINVKKVNVKNTHNNCFIVINQVQYKTYDNYSLIKFNMYIKVQSKAQPSTPKNRSRKLEEIKKIPQKDSSKCFVRKLVLSSTTPPIPEHEHPGHVPKSFSYWGAGVNDGLVIRLLAF